MARLLEELDPEDIGVICPYRSQVLRLKRAPRTVGRRTRLVATYGPMGFAGRAKQSFDAGGVVMHLLDYIWRLRQDSSTYVLGRLRMKQNQN